MPAEDVPFGGNVEAAVGEIMPLLEGIFEMPSLRPDEGTDQWITYMQDLIKQDPKQVTFEQLLEYPELFRTYYKVMLLRGDRDGIRCDPMLICIGSYLTHTYDPMLTCI